MDSHKNARSFPWSRALLIKRVAAGWSVAAAAEAIGLSARRGREWVERGRRNEELEDRSSRPHRFHSIDSSEALRIVELRRSERLTCRQIAHRVGRSRSTVARVLARAGLSRLPSLDPPPPAIRYERARPGDLLHVDVKKLGRIDGVGHRITGVRRSRKRAGWEHLFVCVDDHSRASYAEVLNDERKESAAGFLDRAVQWFRAHGVVVQSVMSDNAWIFQSRPFRSICQRYALRHLRIRPYTPRTNGKAERFIQTLLREWAYRFTYRSSAERTRWLEPYLHFYNRHRRHSSLGDQSPLLRLTRNNVLRHDT
jgi:transposase InsO family protein